MAKQNKNFKKDCLKQPVCRLFSGYKPCPFAQENDGKYPCKHCIPVSRRLLVMQMGGLGSVIRTTVATKEYKRLYPESHITFLTHKGGSGVLQFSPSIDRVLIYDTISFSTLLAEEFDDIYNFEVRAEAASLCSLLKAENKYGFGWDENGVPKIINPISADLLRFQIDDKFRETNQKSVQQLFIESIGLKWEKQTFDVVLKEEDKNWAATFIEKNNLSKTKIVGLNIGSKKAHAKKRWFIDNFVELAKKLNKTEGMKPIILGGPDETEIYQYLMTRLQGENIVGNECNNTVGQYWSLLDACNTVVSATTFGLVTATGLKCKTVTICAPKPIVEIYPYEKGIRIAYSNKYDPDYSSKIKDLTPEKELQIGVKDIPVDMVYQATLDSVKSDFSNPIRFVSNNS